MTKYHGTGPVDVRVVETTGWAASCRVGHDPNSRPDIEAADAGESR